eukprot:224494_1
MDIEAEFNFDSWISTTNLSEIKYLFTKHDATTLESLQTNSKHIKSLLMDPLLFQKCHIIPILFDSIHKLQTVHRIKQLESKISSQRKTILKLAKQLQTIKTETAVTTSIYKKNNLIIFGYIREQFENTIQQTIPLSILPIIQSFYVIKKQKYNMSRLEDQIEIIYSSKAKTKSVSLCTMPGIIENQVDGSTRNLSFIKFLGSLSERAVRHIFSQFKTDTLTQKQLVKLLTLTVIIYKAKVHKMKTGTLDKPYLNASDIKGSVIHLCAWIIRTFGKKTGDKKKMYIHNDDGMLIKGIFDIYVANFPKTSFTSDVITWVTKYVECSGNIKN